MKYSELINDFVDGKLKSADEDKLFSMLSTNQDMRYELRDSIRMEKAFSNDAGSIAPSAAATVGVFGKLGVTPPGAEPIHTGWGRFTAGLSKYSNVVISSAISSLVTAVIILALLNPWGDSDNVIHSGNQVDKSVVAALPDFTLDSKETPVVKSSPESETIITENEPIKEKIVYRYIDRPDTQKEELITSAESDVNELALSVNNNGDEPQAMYSVANIKQMNSKVMDYPYQPKFVKKGYYKELSHEADPWRALGFSAEVKANQYWSFPKASVGYSSTPLFNNTSVALLYKIDNNLSAGIDLRQEYFYQEYEGYEEDIKYRYLQHPNYFSYGLTAKLRFLDFDYMNSFTQIYLGGNQAGPVGRLMYGIEVNPNHGYSFILGLEGSLLLYHHGDQYFYTPKIGLHYGILFDF